MQALIYMHLLCLHNKAAVVTKCWLKGQHAVYEAIKVFKAHVILFDPKEITQFIVDVTNARDKECLAVVTKVLITGKTILTESKLETAQNLTWLSIVQNNSIYGNPCMYIMQRLLHIHSAE